MTLSSVGLVLATSFGPMASTESTLEASHSISSRPAPPQEISWQIIQDAAAQANQISGTNVTLKPRASSDNSKVLLRYNKIDKVAQNQPDLKGTVNDLTDDGWMITIDKDKLEDLCPGILEDPDRLKRILKHILAHEFHHVPGTTTSGGQTGGGGASAFTQTECEHIEQISGDATRICDEANAVLADDTLPDEKKCQAIFDLCSLFKYCQEEVNPRAEEFAISCPNIAQSGGKIIQDCGACPSGDCLVHSHGFGSI